MKRIFLLLGILSALSARQANAQKIELYADATMSSCELVDQGQALRSIHVFYTGTATATAVRFKAPKPACWLGATWIGDVLGGPGFGSAGNSQSEIFIGFGFCLAPPVHAAQINYFATGGAEPCCEVTAMQPSPFPFSYFSCDYNELPVTAGQKVVINPNETCRCQSPLAIETTTWGRVKSLYRQGGRP